MKAHIFQKYLPVLLAVAWGVAHLPFMEADAWQWLTFSRGPLTDEGLYTLQIRNAILTGKLDLWECDNFVKAPLFQLFLWLPFSVFGDSIAVARGSVLIVNSALLAGILFKLQKWPLQLFLYSVFCFPTLFHYGGYAMPEIPAILLAVMGVLSLANAISHRRYTSLFWGIFLFSLGVATKIQFAYLLFLPFFTVGWFILCHPFSIKPFLIAVCTGSLPLWVLAGWLGINYEVLTYMMNHQSGNFVWGAIDLSYLWFNMHTHVLRTPNLWLCVPLLLLGVLRVWKVKKRINPVWVLFSIAFLLEWHKVAMDYLPTRYLLSFWVALAGMALTTGTLKKINTYLVVVAALFLMVVGGIFYTKAFTERSFVQRELTQSVRQHTQPGDIVAGPFAGSFTWGSKTVAKPIWKDFLPKNNTWKSLSPDILVTEPNELGPDNLYPSHTYLRNQGYQLWKIDTLGNWPITIWKN